VLLYGAVRFVEFLKTTVLLTTGAATALATVSVFAVATGSTATTLWVSAGWWLLAAALGAWFGRRPDASPAIARLLATAKASTALPKHRPAAVLLNRLWPLLVLTIAAGAAAVVAPQVPGIGAGFALLGAFAWRRQHSAVAAIEQRDGIRFYVMQTSPIRPIALQRTPGLKAIPPPHANGAVP
jgi:hypothetical protein